MPLLLHPPLQLLTLLLHLLLQLHLPLKLRSNPFLMQLSHLRVAFFLGNLQAVELRGGSKPPTNRCHALDGQ
jgi:hypothetical protein